MKSKDENSIWAGIHENSMSEKGQKSSIWSKPERVPGGGWNVAYRKSTCKVWRCSKVVKSQISKVQNGVMGHVSQRSKIDVCYEGRVSMIKISWKSGKEVTFVKNGQFKIVKTHLQKRVKMPKIVLKGKGRNGVSKSRQKVKMWAPKSDKIDEMPKSGFERFWEVQKLHVEKWYCQVSGWDRSRQGGVKNGSKSRNRVSKSYMGNRDPSGCFENGKIVKMEVLGVKSGGQVQIGSGTMSWQIKPMSKRDVKSTWSKHENNMKIWWQNRVLKMTK